MAIVLLVIVFTLCIIVIFDRLTAKRTTRLSRKEIAFAFSFKVLLGVLYGWVFQKFYHGDDTWKYFYDSLNEYNKLLFQTGTFFKECLAIDSFHKYPDFANNFRDFIENMEYNAIAKTLAVFNIFGFQNYYTDVVLFNIFSFCGAYLLFKLFVTTWPGQRILIYFACFFIPPVTFWLSGIRGDGLLLLWIGMMMYYFYVWQQQGRNKYLFLFTVGCIGLFIFRFQFFLVMIPLLFAWWLCMQFRFRPVVVFISTLAASVFIFFGSILLSSSFSLPGFVASKQHEFLQLKGNTTFALSRLEPNVGSFLSIFPQAFLNSFLRPFPWEAKGILQWAASIEIIFFWIVFILAIPRLRIRGNVALTWFVISFAGCAYLLIGYTVPFPGAIVRYKIIPELLMFLLLVPCLNFRLRKNYI